MEMRLHALSLVGALTALAIPLAAGAQPLQANPQAAAVEQAKSTEKTCPAGWVWEPAGYMGNGHWRPAHCARRNTIPFEFLPHNAID
jgi:hypothetical protein